MADMDALRAVARDLLTLAAPAVARAVAPQAAAAESAAAEAIEGGVEAGVEAGIRSFSPFILEHAQAAFEIADNFMTIADAQPGTDGLEAVLGDMRHRLATDNAELVKHAFMIFATHHPEGRSFQPLPSLLQRAPEKIQPSAPLAAAPAERAEAVHGSTPPEDRLDWYREDPRANEHHEHWHIVYPTVGIPNGQGVGELKDRQGELFFYMHQQMLARYDAERLAVQLPRVVPFQDYRDPIPQGYDPGDLRDGNGNLFVPRPEGTKLRDLPDFGYTLLDHEIRRGRMLDAAESGYLVKGGERIPATGDLLGATEESTIGSVSLDGAGRRSSLTYYGNHHGLGHVLISRSVPGGTENPNGNGVMWDTATAIRDPVFYRWHKHVDDISFRWQQTQPPNDFSDAPQVLLRKGLERTGPTVQTLAPWSPDIILAFADEVPGINNEGFNGQRLGALAFGSALNQAAWNRPFVSGEFQFNDGDETLTIKTTSQLETRFRTCTFTRPDGSTQMIRHLVPRDFCYFIRVRNLLPRIQDVTVRLFLAPAAAQGDRRMWIELDKFMHQLRVSEQAVIFRRSEQSSVVRKPVLKDPCVETPPPPDDPALADEYYYCTCGWPYHLLLPSGTEAGMPFTLLVMITDWEKDQVAQDSPCGSMSFCGAKDRYPDSRSMGYPFDRPFRVSIADTISMVPNMASRPITIKRMGEVGPE